LSAPPAPWASPPPKLALHGGQVHVWRVDLALPEPTVDRLRDLLSPEEAARAERFRFPADRRRFLVAHAALRSILAASVGADPRQLALAAADGGKLFLAGPAGAGPVRFNLSHSGDLALVAVSQDREVGVDLEDQHGARDFEGIAGRYFSEVERRALERMAPDQRRAAFLRGWVLKEAYLKACGDGLRRPLTDFDVTLDEAEPPRLLAVRDRPGDVARWTFRYLHPHPEFVAALAVEGAGWRLAQWEWA
jgi:4'-phosphopantetheinyl transferase